MSLNIWGDFQFCISVSLKELETAYKSLKRNKASGIDNTNCNIVLDFFEELNLHYCIFVEPR